VLFVTIKDETGFSNLVVWGKMFETYRREILQSRLLMVDGKLQVEGEVIHVVVKKCYNLNKLLKKLTPDHNDEPAVIPLSRSDETVAPVPQQRDQPVQNVFYKGRNFH